MAGVLGLLGGLGSGCEAITLPVDITLLLPDDETPLEAADNASLTLEPAGVVETFAVDGLEFSLSFALAPSDEPQTLSLFLADGETLLAWGRTPAVPLDGPDDLRLLMARPGRLVALPQEFDEPDPEAHAAALGETGALVLTEDGSALALSLRTYDLFAAASLDDPPPPSDGILVGGPAGGAWRIAWETTAAVHRYRGGADEWSRASLDDDEAAHLHPRDGAAWVLEPGGEGVLVFGGGDRTDVARVDLRAEPDGDRVTIDAAPALPDPRLGATAIAREVEGTDLPTTVLFGFGGSSPVVHLVERGITLGPPGPWVDAACAAWTDAAAGRSAVLCGGGVRSGVPTGDLVVVTLPASADEEPETTEHLDILQAPMPDPLMWADSLAVYAQGDGRLVTLAAPDLTVTTEAVSGSRVGGGRAAALGTGHTLLVGGSTNDGAALPRWHVLTGQPG